VNFTKSYEISLINLNIFANLITKIMTKTDLKRGRSHKTRIIFKVQN